MSFFTNTIRGATVIAFTGGLACLGMATSAADSDPADVATAGAAMSKGYTLSNCAAQPTTPGVLALLACNQNPDPAGPAGAEYFLFSGADGVTSTFQGLLGQGNLALANCGDSQSPSAWKQGSTGGQVACGTVPSQGGAAQITWTTDSKNMVSFIRASNGDVGSLYKWWLANG
jgi:hypothetical protein